MTYYMYVCEVPVHTELPYPGIRYTLKIDNKLCTHVIL